MSIALDPWVVSAGHKRGIARATLRDEILYRAPTRQKPVSTLLMRGTVHRVKGDLLYVSSGAKKLRVTRRGLVRANMTGAKRYARAQRNLAVRAILRRIRKSSKRCKYYGRIDAWEALASERLEIHKLRDTLATLS